MASPCLAVIKPWCPSCASAAPSSPRVFVLVADSRPFSSLLRLLRRSPPPAACRFAARWQSFRCRTRDLDFSRAGLGTASTPGHSARPIAGKTRGTDQCSLSIDPDHHSLTGWRSSPPGVDQRRLLSAVEDGVRASATTSCRARPGCLCHYHPQLQTTAASAAESTWRAPGRPPFRIVGPWRSVPRRRISFWTSLLVADLPQRAGEQLITPCCCAGRWC